IVGRLVAGDVKTVELAPQALGHLVHQRTPSRKMPLFEIHQPREAQLQGRTIASGADRVFGRYEIDVRQQKPGLDARDVQCLRTDGANAPRSARLHEGIPNSLGGLRFHPKLIAQVAGESRARHGQPMRPESEVSDFERLQVLDSPQAERLENRARSRTLYRQSGYLLRNLADLHVEPDGGIEQPIDLPFRRANPIFMLSQAKQ